MYPEHREYHVHWGQWVAASAASSAMIGKDVAWYTLTDYDYSAFESRLPILMKNFCVIIGAIVGAVAADTFGRRRTLLVTLFFVIPRIVALWLPAAGLWIWINAFFAAFGSGVTCVVVPLYISEVASINNRGNVMAVQQLVHYYGILCIYIWAVNGLYWSYDDWGSETRRVTFTVFTTFTSVISILFQLIILGANPETPRYLIRKKRDQATANSLASLESIEYIRSGQGRTDLCAKSCVNDTKEGWCERVREIVRYENRRSLAIILSLIAIRWASGQEWISFILFNMITKYRSNSEIYYFAVAIFSAASLTVITYVILTVHLLVRKKSLLIVISMSFIAAAIGTTPLMKHYFLLVGVLYTQCIGHFIFIGVTLAYAGEFFSINVRSIAIATVISSEVLLRSLFFIIREFYLESALSEPKYTWGHSCFNCLALFVAFWVVFILFPEINKTPTSEIQIEHSVGEKESLQVEKSIRITSEDKHQSASAKYSHLLN